MSTGTHKNFKKIGEINLKPFKFLFKFPPMRRMMVEMLLDSIIF